jgi:hypothetical protein
MKRFLQQIKRLFIFFLLLWLICAATSYSFFVFLTQADEDKLVIDLYLQKKSILAYFKILAAVAFTLTYLCYPWILKYNRFKPIYAYLGIVLFYVIIFLSAYLLGGWLMNFAV